VTVTRHSQPRRRIDFRFVAERALPSLPTIARHWLPDGRLQGDEWVARNPTRPDEHPGSFKINLRTGRWSDFATGDKGGDAISLAAYLFDMTQAAAARKLAVALGITAERLR
jgi:hypothetical protein